MFNVLDLLKQIKESKEKESKKYTEEQKNVVEK